MKLKNKQGISLIVLVITIIVMVVLASAVIITLSNTGIINKASDATKLTNLNQVKNLANLAWTDAYLEGLRDADLRDKVLETLTNGGVNTDDYTIIVGNNGVTVQDGVVLNEYGFYYDQVYFGVEPSTGIGIGYIFYEDGTADWCINGAFLASNCSNEVQYVNTTYDEVKDELYFCYMGEYVNPIYSKNKIVDNFMFGELTVSENGEKLIPTEDIGFELTRQHVQVFGVRYDEIYKGISPFDDNLEQEIEITVGKEYIAMNGSSAPTQVSKFGNVGMIGSGGGPFISSDGSHFFISSYDYISLLKTTNTKAGITEETIADTSNWDLKADVYSNAGVKYNLVKGEEKIEVGSTINYMPNGVGSTPYKGEWRLWGIDEDGNLLILSMASVTGTTYSLSGKDGYKNGLTNIENIASTYCDGTIGVRARSIQLKDYKNYVYKLTDETDQTEYTYSWNGTTKPTYSYLYNGENKSYTCYTAHANGFMYFDGNTNEWVDVPYASSGSIATLKNNYYDPDIITMNVGSKFYKMIAEMPKCWVADKFEWVTGTNGAYYGLYSKNYNSSVGWTILAYTTKEVKTVAHEICAMVTLAPGAKLTKQADGSYNVSL